ncbi:MAG: helix-turn-helix domain-containing protein [Clostridia bacterium]|nr:helix-turn-helix domain-containing protein [Clostridia bacterium]
MDFLEIENRKMKTDFDMSEPHSHDYYELYFLLEGSRAIFLQDKMFVLPPNTFCVIPPFCLHKTEGGPYKRININISSDLLKKEEIKFFSDCSKHFAMRLDGEYLPLTKGLLEEVSALKAMNSKDRKNYELAIVKTIFYFLQKQNLQPLPVASESPIKQESDPIVLKMVFYINENYQKEITLEKLCKQFFLSKATLCKRFKSVLRCSIMEYLFRVRLNKAKSLLSTTGKSIEEISFLCGFSSANYFSLVFKKEIGLSPLNYRKTR